MRLIRDDLLVFQPDSDPEIALAAYQMLTDSPTDFIERGSSAEEVFWSRYFWFCLYVKIRLVTDGFDAGLEQQAFQLLEHPFPDCEPDWWQLEIVDTLAEQVTSTWLSRRDKGN